MQSQNWLTKIRNYTEAFLSKNAVSRCYLVLAFFLLAVILISFFIPVLNFGRFFGTDDYTHLFHTKEMVSTNGIADFYEKMGNLVSNPGSGENMYNYPFGLWIFGTTIVKITGIPLLSAELLFAILFFLILLGSFYLYSGTFLELKEQRILAVLFLLSMPTAALGLFSYRPSIFILPFLFILLYIALKEPVQWKLFPVIWLLIFVITVSHTGSLIFLIIFSILFILLYSLLWGRFSISMFIVLLSTFVIYIFSLKSFPLIANQYEVKSILFLSPGNFFATKFNFFLPLELGNIFYQNMMVNQEYVYTLILGAFIFTIAKLFRYIHRKVSEKYSQPGYIFPVTLPISNISHSAVATPLWIGPVHVFLSFFGFFRIDSKGKCMLITALLVGIVPDLLQTSQGINAATGALREISYLSIIIPITSALGFWMVISYLGTLKIANKNLVVFMAWLLVLLAIIITPTLATTYYNPKIAGEDYINDGMKWLGNTGNLQEKVVGYGYRTVPIYTNMTDASYGLTSGNEMRTFTGLLKRIYFSPPGNNVNDLRDRFGVKYILVSDKMTANLAKENDILVIDKNPALDKIYSSKDFGVYEVITTSEKRNEQIYIAKNISFQQIGSTLQIETEIYKVVLNANNPTIEQFGPPQDNYLGEGIFLDSIQVSGMRETYINPFSPPDEVSADNKLMIDQYPLNNLSVPYEIKDNQIIYRTVLTDQQKGENEASLLVRYTFYPTCIKREFLISNDWVTSSSAKHMDVNIATKMFTPLNDFIVKNDQTLIKRHVYPTQDSVGISEIIQKLYIYDGDHGIFIQNEPTATYPTKLTYAGSTLYNYSGLSFAQSASLKPGASLHLTQFLSPGDMVTAERNILNQEGFRLMNYPDGITPIILSGYRTPSSDIRSNGTFEKGYLVLLDEDIPYSEVIVLDQILYSPADLQNGTESAESGSLPEASTPVTYKIDLRTIPDNFPIIGSGNTVGPSFSGVPGSFDDFNTQERSISSLIDDVNREGKSLVGYMPASMNYNLDTLKIISDKNIPFILSTGVNPPYRGVVGVVNKEPQMAAYHNAPNGVALFPVSNPLSNSLSTRSDKSEIFSAWEASINEAEMTDGMVFFIIRSEDIGNPEYTEDIRALIAYAKTKGLTFATPESIADHLKKIQDIQYSGSVINDLAVINMTNNNDNPVQQVTFRVVLPSLKSGSYTARGGTIIKTKAEINRIIVYVSTDISAHATRDITIEPDTPRQKIIVTIPRQPIEGPVTISIGDSNGNPLTAAFAIIDSKYYQPDAEGKVNIDLSRGKHTLEIQCPGYDAYNSILNVKGRIYLIERLFTNAF